VTPRILVIRGGAIGDFILTLPAIRLLRENFPDVAIEILGYKHIVALAEKRFYASATRSIEYAGMAGFFVPGSDLDPELKEYFAGFQQVISYLFDPDGFFEGNLRRAGVKNLIQGSPRVDDSDHAARQLARPLQSLALYLEDGAPQVFPSEPDRESARQFLAGSSDPVIALHPGSGSDRKNWDLENWRKLGDWLLASGRAGSLLVVGGEADRERLATLQRVWAGAPVQWALNLPLPELGALLEASALFLGHDSGISHLAAATGTRCVLLFGPTDPDVWGPLNRGVKILAAPDGNLGRLTLETVCAATHP
jgi:heptosyltransferase-2